MRFIVCLCAMALVHCGTTVGAVQDDAGSGGSEAPTFAIGGTIEGLDGTIVLQNNGGDNLTLSADGAFVFATEIADLTPYVVTVMTQPEGTTCTVAHASGTVNGDNVNSISITCSERSYLIGGNVTGLVGTLVLQLNGGHDLAVSADGGFVFEPNLVFGTAYAVTFVASPEGLTCSVASGSGTVPGHDVTDVAITCAHKGYTLGGTLTGLEEGAIVLQNNGGDDLTLTADGSFFFDAYALYNFPYVVSVLHAPTGFTCSVAHGSRIMPSADVDTVEVTCSRNSYAIGGTVSGLTGSVILRNNGGDDLTLNADGAFTFATAIAHGSDYEVTIPTQPNGQICSFGNHQLTATGSVDGANVNNLVLTCRTAYSVGGTLSGLADDSTVTLQNNQGDDLTLHANGAFTFAAPVTAESAYNVSVLSDAAWQTCTVTSGASGTMGSSAVTNVSVVCTGHRVRIFATSATTTGVIAGSNGAVRGAVDTMCTMTAQSLGLTCSGSSGGVHALISTNANDEIRDMPNTFGVPTDAQIWSMVSTAVQVSDTWAHFLDYNVNLMAPLGGSFWWWSGSHEGGDYYEVLSCTGWTSSSGNGSAGRTDSVIYDRLLYAQDACSSSKKLLCVCY